MPVGEGGTVDGPIRQLLPSDRAGVVARFAVENAVSEDQEVALNELGVIALRQIHLTGLTAFLNLPSLHRPTDYDSEAARMNAKTVSLAASHASLASHPEEIADLIDLAATETGF